MLAIEVIGTALTRSDGLKVRRAIPTGCRTDAEKDIFRANDMCMVTPSGPQALLLLVSMSYRSRRTLGKDLREVMTHPFKDLHGHAV